MNELMKVEPPVLDAYRFARKLRPGCQHQLGCKCEPPYWLRASSAEEEAHEKRIQGKP